MHASYSWENMKKFTGFPQKISSLIKELPANESPGKITRSVVDGFKNISLVKQNSKAGLLKNISLGKYESKDEFKDQAKGSGDCWEGNSLKDAISNSSSGYTKILTKNKSYDWIVENIRDFRPAPPSTNSLCKRADAFIDIRSPTFIVTSENITTNWHLFVRFGEYKDGFPVHYASIWLVLENSRNDTESCLTNLKASFEIRIVNEQGRVEQEQKSGYRTFNLKKENNPPWGFENFIAYQEFDNQNSRLFSGNKLRVTLELKIFQGSVHFPFPQKRMQESVERPDLDDSRPSPESGDGDRRCLPHSVPKNDLSNAIGNLWKSDAFSDVRIVVGNRTFSAHKVILAARSAVFSTMLSSDSFAEHKSNEIALDALSPDAVERMLQFIYTDRTKIPNCTDEIAELIEAADMYELPALKYDCYFELVCKLDETNAAKIAVISYYYRPADDILAVIKEFIHSNLPSIIYTRTFKEMFRKYNQAFSEMLSPEAFRTISLM